MAQDQHGLLKKYGKGGGMTSWPKFDLEGFTGLYTDLQNIASPTFEKNYLEKRSSISHDLIRPAAQPAKIILSPITDETSINYQTCAFEVQKLDLKTSTEFDAWCTANPEERLRLCIPSAPHSDYANAGWVDWRTFLGNPEGELESPAKGATASAAKPTGKPTVARGASRSLVRKSSSRMALDINMHAVRKVIGSDIPLDQRVEKIFTEFDKDHSGLLEAEEVRQMLTAMDVDVIDDDDFESVMQTLDVNNDGGIGLKELSAWITKHSNEADAATKKRGNARKRFACIFGWLSFCLSGCPCLKSKGSNSDNVAAGAFTSMLIKVTGGFCCRARFKKMFQPRGRWNTEPTFSTIYGAWFETLTYSGRWFGICMSLSLSPTLSLSISFSLARSLSLSL
jgi:hypothetical protein